MKVVGWIIVAATVAISVAVWSYRKDRRTNPDTPPIKILRSAIILGVIAGVTIPLSVIYILYTASQAEDRRNRMRNF